MANTHIDGRVVRIAHPPVTLYSLFTDLTNFTRNFPAEMREKADISTTPDTLLAKVQGFEIGMRISERVPYSLVKYEQYGSSPIPFEFTVKLTDVGNGSCEFQLTMDSELSGMFKMMLECKLREMVDKVTDGIESAMGSL